MVGVSCLLARNPEGSSPFVLMMAKSSGERRSGKRTLLAAFTLALRFILRKSLLFAPAY